MKYDSVYIQEFDLLTIFDNPEQNRMKSSFPVKFILKFRKNRV